MKFPIIVLLLCVSTLAQSKQPSAAPPAGVPADAVSTDGTTWRWVDKSGKAWIYRLSPFGLMRNAEVKTSEAGKRPAGVPADALPLPDGVWRWIDAAQHTLARAGALRALSVVDLLICGVAAQHGLEILHDDRDFVVAARHLTDVRQRRI